MKTLIVTGGSSGVGAALVSRWLNAGHTVINLDISAPQEKSHAASWRSCDLSSEASIDAVANALPSRIDGLANVAGIARATDPAKVLAVNFLGVREITRRITRRLSEGCGILSVSSIAGRDWRNRYDRIVPLLETPSMSAGLSWCKENNAAFAKDPYSFSKRCVTAWTLREAQNHVHRSTRILCVSPGGIDTPLSPQFEALMGAEQTAWSRSQVGRPAQPDEIAQVIDLLLTQACSWLNGVDIPIDRGYCAGLDSGWIDFAQSPVMVAARARRSEQR